MTTNQLKYFITAAECLNFTEAGKKHFISQTAITQHIQALEEQLGVQLFERKKKRVFLTPAGEVFYREAKAILERARMSLQKVKNAAEGISGTVNIGYVKGMESPRIALYLRTFLQKNPSVKFQLFRCAHFDLLHDLDQGKLDFVFNYVYDSTDLSSYSWYQISKEPLYAVLPPSHPYAQLSSIRRYDLRDEAFLLTEFYDNEAAGSYGPIIPEMFAKSGFIPNIVERSSNAETLLLLVSCGIGITILPEMSIMNLQKDLDLSFIPLIGEYEHVNFLGLWKEKNENPVAKVFYEHVKNFKQKI